MKRAPYFVLALCASTGCMEDYDPPAELASTNIQRGLFDLAQGDLVVELTEPVVEETLRVRLLSGVYGTEGDVCRKGSAGGLPGGCDGEAAELVKPASERIRVASRRVIRIQVDDLLVPFGLYVLLVDAGLEDDGGRRRRVPIDLRFQVQGDIAENSTDLEPGMWFARTEVQKPLPTKVHFFFWMAVDQANGRLKIWGCDADPIDRSIKESDVTDINPEIWDPIPDPSESLGYPLEIGSGTVADTDQGRIFVFEPFDLVTTGPPVTISQGEFQGTLYEESVEHGFSEMLSAKTGPPGVREVVKGQLSAPETFLGSGPDAVPLGEGQGPFAFYRLAEDEQPPLEDILPLYVTPEKVLDHPFDE